MRLESTRFIAESYFDFYNEHGTSTATSKKLFSKLPGRPSSNSQLAALLSRPPTVLPEHEDAIKKVHKTISEHLFPQWLLQLDANTNLALYGYGSKTEILKDFISAATLDGRHVFRLQCFKKEDSFTSLLQTVVQILGSSKHVTQATVRRLPELASIILALPQQILLVIEMADAPSMRNAETCKTLAMLACSDHIRLILTFEHMNSLLLTSERHWSTMNLAWHDCTTLRPYSEELTTLLTDRRSTVDEATRWQGAQFVLASLTKTGRSVFKVLAEHQLGADSCQPPSPTSTRRKSPESEGDSDEDDDHEVTANGMSVVGWYQRCQEQFLVSNEIAFRTQLTEFVDHELVRSVDDAGQNGSEFFIPFSKSQIESLLVDL